MASPEPGGLVHPRLSGWKIYHQPVFLATEDPEILCRSCWYETQLKALGFIFFRINNRSSSSNRMGVSNWAPKYSIVPISGRLLYKYLKKIIAALHFFSRATLCCLDKKSAAGSGLC